MPAAIRTRSLSIPTLLGSACLCFAACQPDEEPAIPPVTGARIVAADEEPGSWLSHGRGYSEQRFSPLTQIDAANVQHLGLAWYYDIDDHNVVEATPLVNNGVMFLTSAFGVVHALDARTGEQRWRFDPEVTPETLVLACCQPVNRGVAAWMDKIYVGALDGRLIALDARSGAPVWETQTTDPKQPFTITGAPRVMDGKVIIGNAGAEYGVRGYVSAYSAETGELMWRFFTVPGNPALGFESDAMRDAAKTWNGSWWEMGGGGTVWDGMAYDPDLNLLYIGTGNGAPWNHNVRSPGGGDNLFLSSIVALRADTGEYVWHYQTTPGDSWDFTATQPIILADLEIEGSVRKVLMQAPKNGFFYVLDRQTGKVISAQPFAAVNWASHVDLETGRPVELPNMRPAGEDQIVVQPGPSGAHNWNPMAFSPATGLVYIPTADSRYLYQEDPISERVSGFWNLGYDLSVRMDFSAAGSERRSRSYLLAWDPVTQKEAWRADGSGGGTLATAGNLVFRGTVAGDFSAYDATSGKLLWSADVQNRGVAGPIAYEIDGAQYVAIALGRGAATMSANPVPHPARLPHANRVVAFKLDGKAKLPELAFTPQPLRSPPEEAVDPDTAEAGRYAFHRFCFGCHGREARGNKIQPDLRYSPHLDSGQWEAIVLEGALTGAGMIGFKNVLTPELAEAIRAYVILEAQNEAAAQRGESDWK